MAAVVDLNINEGETFIMDLEFWEDEDNTLPTDVSTWVWAGSFVIGPKTIPMVITRGIEAINVIEATVAYVDMSDLTAVGKYDIEATFSNERFRIIQGNVRVSPEVTI